jgi:hypothetical protein
MGNYALTKALLAGVDGSISSYCTMSVKRVEQLTLPEVAVTVMV